MWVFVDCGGGEEGEVERAKKRAQGGERGGMHGAWDMGIWTRLS